MGVVLQNAKGTPKPLPYNSSSFAEAIVPTESNCLPNGSQHYYDDFITELQKASCTWKIGGQSQLRV